MLKVLRGCLIITVIIVVLLFLTCGILAETTTPLSLWLYQHNYYFQYLVDALRGH